MGVFLARHSKKDWMPDPSLTRAFPNQVQKFANNEYLVVLATMGVNTTLEGVNFKYLKIP